MARKILLKCALNCASDVERTLSTGACVQIGECWSQRKKICPLKWEWNWKRWMSSIIGLSPLHGQHNPMCRRFGRPAQFTELWKINGKIAGNISWMAWKKWELYTHSAYDRYQTHPIPPAQMIRHFLCVRHKIYFIFLYSDNLVCGAQNTTS